MCRRFDLNVGIKFVNVSHDHPHATRTGSTADTSRIGRAVYSKISVAVSDVQIDGS